MSVARFSESRTPSRATVGQNIAKVAVDMHGDALASFAPSPFGDAIGYGGLICDNHYLARSVLDGIYMHAAHPKLSASGGNAIVKLADAPLTFTQRVRSLFESLHTAPDDKLADAPPTFAQRVRSAFESLHTVTDEEKC